MGRRRGRRAVLVLVAAVVLLLAGCMGDQPARGAKDGQEAAGVEITPPLHLDGSAPSTLHVFIMDVNGADLTRVNVKSYGVRFRAEFAAPKEGDFVFWADIAWLPRVRGGTNLSDLSVHLKWNTAVLAEDSRAIVQNMGLRDPIEPADAEMSGIFAAGGTLPLKVVADSSLTVNYTVRYFRNAGDPAIIREGKAANALAGEPGYTHGSAWHAKMPPATITIPVVSFSTSMITYLEPTFAARLRYDAQCSKPQLLEISGETRTGYRFEPATSRAAAWRSFAALPPNCPAGQTPTSINVNLSFRGAIEVVSLALVLQDERLSADAANE